MVNKYHWSVFQIFEETQKEVTRIQATWSGIAVIITSSAYVISSPPYALIAALGCALVDKMIAGIWIEK